MFSHFLDGDFYIIQNVLSFRNSVQLEKNILSGEVDMDHPSLSLVSQDAKNFIGALLVLDTRARWTARQCRAHK